MITELLVALCAICGVFAIAGIVSKIILFVLERLIDPQ